MLWLPTVAALVVSTLATGWLIGWLRRAELLDQPNERSSHEIPTPRGGGLGILVGLLAAGAVVALWSGELLPPWNLPPWNLVAAVAAVAVVGMLDDRRSVPSGVRLAVHLGAALLVAVPAGGLSRLPLPAPFDVEVPAALGLVLAVLWLVAVLNFVNFMDGIDGITGLQLLIAGVALGVLHHGLHASGCWGWLGPALAAASAGFLVFNWRARRPARVFLGDVGSGSLGLLVAAAPFTFGATPGASQPAAEWQLTAAVLIPYVALFLWPFLADATFTLLRRLLRGERVWQAHRSHLYQRLVQSGVGHATVAAGVGAMAVLTSTLALTRQADGWALAAAGGLFVLQLGFTLVRERQSVGPASIG